LDVESIVAAPAPLRKQWRGSDKIDDNFGAPESFPESPGVLNVGSTVGVFREWAPADGGVGKLSAQQLAAYGGTEKSGTAEDGNSRVCHRQSF